MILLLGVILNWKVQGYNINNNTTYNTNGFKNIIINFVLRTFKNIIINNKKKILILFKIRLVKVVLLMIISKG